MRILLFNLATDLDDPVLGFTSRWITILAQKVERIYVITMYAGTIDVPENVQVFSVGREKGYGEIHRALRFYQYLFHILQADHIDACFSHMIPIFSILAAPILRVKQIPIITWYAHPSLTNSLKVAHFTSNRMVTSLPTSYPYKTDKLTIIGQGIDTDLFSPDESKPDQPPIILCVGRLSPVKDHVTLLKAAAQLKENLKKPFRIVILGQSIGDGAERYQQELLDLTISLNIENIIEFARPMPVVSLPAWYRRCTVHVNLTPSGFGDKVAWEAMSCGRPCMVANTDFTDTLGNYKNNLLFKFQSPTHLAEQLHYLMTISEHERDEIGTYLRSQVIKLHSLEGLADKLVKLFSREQNLLLNPSALLR